MELLGHLAPIARFPSSAGSFAGEAGIETIHRADPDAILLVCWNPDPREDLAAMLAQDRLWHRLRAARAGRVIPINGFEAVTFQSIPTAVRLLDTVAPRLYPEIFPAPLDEARIAAILDG